MAITLDDADEFAAALARQTCLDGHDAPPIETALARWRWQTDPERIGVLVYDLPRSAAGTGWAWVRIGTEHRRPAIMLRKGEKGNERRGAIGHETGHIVIATLALDLAPGVHEERWCNRFSAAWHAPAALVRRAWQRSRSSGERVGSIIRTLPPTSLALRLGEVGCASVAVLRRERVLYTAGPLVLPANDIAPLARIALRVGRAEGDGLRAFRLSDGAERVAVMLAA